MNKFISLITMLFVCVFLGACTASNDGQSKDQKADEAKASEPEKK